MRIKWTRILSDAIPNPIGRQKEFGTILGAEKFPPRALLLRCQKCQKAPQVGSREWRKGVVTAWCGHPDWWGPNLLIFNIERVETT